MKHWEVLVAKERGRYDDAMRLAADRALEIDELRRQLREVKKERNTLRNLIIDFLQDFDSAVSFPLDAQSVIASRACEYAGRFNTALDIPGRMNGGDEKASMQ